MKNIIRTSTYFNISSLEGLRSWHVKELMKHGFSGVKLSFNLLAPGSIPAEINNGRWVAQCLNCGDTTLADPDYPYFCCWHCGNAKSDGRFIKVVFPSNAREIESILCLRPHHDKMNWKLSETVSDLRAENIDRGVK